jgi:hypothetical protein
MVGRVWPRHSGGGRPLNSVVRRHFPKMEAAQQRRASPIFLGWAWASAGTILLVVGALFLAGNHAPHWLVSIAQAGVLGVALTGAVVASGYVLSSFWMHARVVSGIAALTINLGFLILVFAAPQIH